MTTHRLPGEAAALAARSGGANHTVADASRTAEADVAAAARALVIEADGIQAVRTALSGTLGAALVAALDVLAAATGRVVVTGMGKSGHVARKIASTLASTGTPALFVHPGEASHGDLGMVAGGDVVMALSNSGETEELSDILAYTKLRRIPLIAMTGRAPSALADAADVALVLPAMPEACPMGLAPTTSTTSMLALGDALAVAMLERKGFSPDHFHVLHPGGKLGRQFLRVQDLMHTGDAMPLAALGTAMADAILVMTEKRLGCLGVVDGAGLLVGIITDGDLRRHMADNLLAQKVERIMTPRPKTIRRTAMAAEAVGFMTRSQHPFTALWVVEDGRPVGIIHIHDCLRAGVA
ncbi:MAG: KpsF/GutQ family sugar-phosphate isomerase [Alphaproteobacteria bacterium]|nr:KpsF/GutQ family sugar-phosphate isomerase [Alphaproteobacteria bacterium]